jgi:hypothetical protein
MLVTPSCRHLRLLSAAFASQHRPGGDAIVGWLDSWDGSITLEPQRAPQPSTAIAPRISGLHPREQKSSAAVLFTITSARALGRSLHNGATLCA